MGLWVLFWSQKLLSLIRCIEITQLYNSELLKVHCTNSVSIHSSCYKKMPQIGWLIHNRNLFFTVLEAGDLSSEDQDQGVMEDSASGVCQLPGFTHGWPTSSHVLTWQKGQGALCGLLNKDTDPSHELHPHDPITSWRLHLLTPSLWGLGLQHINLRGDNNIQSTTNTFHNI